METLRQDEFLESLPVSEMRERMWAVYLEGSRGGAAPNEGRNVENPAVQRTGDWALPVIDATQRVRVEDLLVNLTSDLEQGASHVDAEEPSRSVGQPGISVFRGVGERHF